MDQRTRTYAAAGATVLMFLLVQLGALALVEPFYDAGFQQVEDTSDPTNSLLYIGAILAATVVMLLIIKYDVRWILRGFIILTSGMLAWYVFTVVVPPVVAYGGWNVLAVAAAAGVSLALYVHPEWYVIDTAAIVMGAGAAGLFGISFDVLPVIVLLTLLAVYDAISVYGTEHMLTLAEGVMDLHLPILFVVPTSLSYSFLAATGGSEEADDDDGGAEPAADGGPDHDDESSGEAGADHAERDPLDRDALFIGLGDAVMPTIMVASAAFFVDVPRTTLFGLTANLPALTSMVGTLLGLVILLRMVLKGRPHAGLPLLNGGAIGGYLLGALVSGISLAQALGIAPYL